MTSATADTALDTSLPLRLLACASVLTALADWLFFRQSLGINVAIHLVALAAVVMLLNPGRMGRRETIVAVGLVAAALLALAEELTPLSALAGLCAIALFALIASGSPAGRSLRGSRMRSGCWPRRRSGWRAISSPRAASSGTQGVSRAAAAGSSPGPFRSARCPFRRARNDPTSERRELTCRTVLELQQIERASDWRRWSYRNHRLQQHLQSLRSPPQHAVPPT